jgi:thiamine-monophosphate kinase
MKPAANKTDEFSRIANILAPLAAGYPGAFGLTDDAAVVQVSAGYELVVTTDTLVAGVHFLPGDEPGSIAAKLLRVNLSDLAAMGGRPIGYTLNIALPSEVSDPWLRAFAAGLASDQAEFSVTLIGGDSVTTSGPITLTLTAFGDVVSGGELRRSGAKVGDIIYVSGTIGDGAAGLAVATGEFEGLSTRDRDYLLQRYTRPQPRVALGQRLLGVAHAAIDVSDGFVADLGHIAKCSEVSIDVEADKIPLSDAAKSALEKSVVSMDRVLTGGDDYELAVSVPKSARNVMAALAKFFTLPLTEVGRVCAGTEVRILDQRGADITPVKKGYVHV